MGFARTPRGSVRIRKAVRTMSPGGHRGSRGIPYWRTEPDLTPPARPPKLLETFTPGPVVSDTGSVIGVANSFEEWVKLNRMRIDLNRDSRL